jgi:hypothetical protein
MPTTMISNVTLHSANGCLSRLRGADDPFAHGTGHADEAIGPPKIRQTRGAPLQSRPVDPCMRRWVPTQSPQPETPCAPAVREEAPTNATNKRDAIPTRRSVRPRCPKSQVALAMLTMHPIQTTALLRFHVALKKPGGGSTVYDRALGEHFEVFTPRFGCEFRAGYHAGLWYVRRALEINSRPRSPGFATARAAIEALRDGHWSDSRFNLNRTTRLARVSWSTEARPERIVSPPPKRVVCRVENSHPLPAPTR